MFFLATSMVPWEDTGKFNKTDIYKQVIFFSPSLPVLIADFRFFKCFIFS